MNRIVLLLLWFAVWNVGADEAPISKTGDGLIVDARQLVVEKRSRLVADGAASGGEAAETLGAELPVHITTPLVPAGRYRIAVRAAIARRPSSSEHVGRLVVSSPVDPTLDETIPFNTSDFEKAGVYREFALEVTQPPVTNGATRFTVSIKQESPSTPLRIANLEFKALAIAPVLVHKVWPEKLLARCGADQPITVGVSSLAETVPSGLKLRLELLHDLGETILVGEKDLALRPHETAEVVFPWNAGDVEYGYEARATIVDARGKPVSVLSDYFSVSRSHYKLRILSTPGGGSWPWIDQKFAEFYVKSLRESYQNYREDYAFPPGNPIEMVPRHRFWSSGQVSEWVYDRDVVKANVALMNRLGLYATSYEICIYSGWPGQEFSRQHPEMIAFDKTGRPLGGVNTAFWQTKENAYGDTNPPVVTPFKREFPNNTYVWPANDDLMRRIADEIVLLHKELGFSAIRWDAHPAVFVVKDDKGGVPGTGFGSMIYNYDGKPITDLIPKGDLDRQTLHNMQLIKERVRQAAPDFEWGYNAGYDSGIEQQPLSWQEIVHDAGIWVEGGFRDDSAGPSDPANTWANFMDKLWLTSQLVIRNGGYPIHGTLSSDSAFMRKFLLSLFWAQGSHPSIVGQKWGEFHEYARFATRYSQYLFDPRLRPLLHPNPDVHVTGWIRWEDRNADEARPLAEEVKIESPRPVFFPEKFLFTRELDNGKRDTVLHLINDPGKPYLDFTEPNYPSTQENLTVSLLAPAGLKAQAAWLLSPDGMPMETALEIERGEAGWIKVRVPRLALWTIVVLNWEKE